MSEIPEDHVSFHRFHCERPERIRAKARRVLREQIAQNPDYKTSRLDADVIIEQVWNVLVGNDKIKAPESKPRLGRVWRNKRQRRARAASESTHDR